MAIDHLYVHVPFCARKCPYCDFNSHAGRDAEIDAYVRALLSEARARASGARPRTLFIGGGTPTHPDASQIDRYLDGLLGAIDPGAIEEFTVEANPGTLSPEKVRVLARHGVDRVSLGAQSFDEARLRALGRIHGPDEIVRGAEALRDGGIRRLSIDLMLATPGQSIGEQRRDIDRALALSPEHVSTYVLAYEEGTAFTRAMGAGRLPPPGEDRDLRHMRDACAQLRAAGLARYEVSNHALPGAECRHNLAYWRNGEWLGLGAGAHSHLGGARSKNVDDPAEYVGRIGARGTATEWEERPEPASALLESLMMGLRLVEEGVDLADLARRHGVDPRVLHADALARHVGAGLLERRGDRLRCTPAGLEVLNRLLLDFVP